MKNRALLPVLFLMLCIACVFAAASGGDSSDPLVSLSYLNSTYTKTVHERADAMLSTGDRSSTADVWAETRMKAGDLLVGTTGSSVLLLAGSATVSFPSGAVVDCTVGKEMTSGSVLVPRHRYLVAENTSATFTIISKTAVLNAQKPYAVTLSSATDYNAMAQALKSIRLFRGSLTGFGSGFDLEVSPTRLQALIMFIRLLGEEDEALAYSGAIPFTDIETGSEPARYIGYAFSKGYTNGYTKTTFCPSQKVNAYQFAEFVLRALGYSSTANTDLTKTLSRAETCGVLTSGEVAALSSAPFLRADLVYISYYALDAQVSGKEQTLRQSLVAKEIFTDSEYITASGLITAQRLS